MDRVLAFNLILAAMEARGHEISVESITTLEAEAEDVLEDARALLTREVKSAPKPEAVSFRRSRPSSRDRQEIRRERLDLRPGTPGPFFSWGNVSRSYGNQAHKQYLGDRQPVATRFL